MARNTIFRSMHDLGLAAWFGGTLANAAAWNPAAASAAGARSTGAVANAGWDRWTPLNAVAIATHLVGGVGELGGNLGRVQTQKGVASMTIAKTAVTAVALGVTGYSRVLGRKVSQHDDVPASSGTEPAAATPDEVAAAQRQVSLLQWLVPALTGTLVVMSSFAGEQQRPSEVKKGMARRLMG